MCTAFIAGNHTRVLARKALLKAQTFLSPMPTRNRPKSFMKKLWKSDELAQEVSESISAVGGSLQATARSGPTAVVELE